jgi:hypothetical protein
MLAKLNLKLIKVGGGSSGGIGFWSKSPASGTLASGSSGTPRAKLAAAVSHATPIEVSPLSPVGMMAALVADGGKDSTDNFCWAGDEDGVTFEDAHKPKALVFSYAPSSPGPSCCNVSVKSFLPSPTCLATQLGDDIVLPPILIKSLLKAIPTTNGGTPFRLVVADTGATDHMVPDCGAFISYKSLHGLWVRMGNNSFVLFVGRGMAIISLNGQHLLICHVLHVPELWVPLYSLRAHLCQSGCSFVGSYETGLHVYFPGVVLTVDTSLDCHLAYKPLGKTVPLLSLHYIQPQCPPVVYPPDHLVFLAQTRAQSQREQLVNTLCGDSPAVSPSSPLESDTTSFPQFQLSSDPHLSPDSPTLLLTLSWDNITCLIHHEVSSFPPICPCD